VPVDGTMNSKLPKAWLFGLKAVHEFPLWKRHQREATSLKIGNSSTGVP